MPAVPIYVEICIRGALADVWEKSQDPSLHQRWDLRFSRIEYLPRADEEPQRFLYATRIGFGMQIAGEGESVGEHKVASGEKTSSLKFWSADAKSLIEVGSGYWRYIPQESGTRFLTRYDYQTRFGVAGRVIDRLLFRPLLGWATAWSFDRLRLWIEQGVAPELSRDAAVIYSLARVTVAFVWIYHGLVPKLLFHSAQETALLNAAGLEAHSNAAIQAIGWAEIAFGAAVLAFWRARWPLWLTIAAMAVALVVVGATSSQALVGAFNPVTFNVCVAALALLALIAGRHTPSASRCRRRKRSA